MNTATKHPSTTTASDDFQWSDRFVLGYKPIDDTHKEFVDIVGRMGRAADADMLALLDEFAAHAKAHFGEEDALMISTNFPPRDCHIDEHAAVMRSVQEVQVLVREGHVDVCRSLVEELMKWFPSHADHLDSALAHWVVKQSMGGKPVVIRRDVNLR